MHARKYVFYIHRIHFNFDHFIIIIPNLLVKHRVNKMSPGSDQARI